MSSTLDDFFGDGRIVKTPECLRCGRTDGELIVAINDAYGPTHWIHPTCQTEMERESEQQMIDNAHSATEWAARDEWEEPNGK